MKKYELTNETIRVNGRTLFRIKALRDFSDVKKGDLGGFIEKEDNLSHEGNCWVYDDALVYENAKVSKNACVFGDAQVHGNAHIYGNAKVVREAEVFGNAIVEDNAIVGESARVYGNAIVEHGASIYGNAEVYGDARVRDWSQVYEDARVYGDAVVGNNADVYGEAEVCGNAVVFGNACLAARKKFSQGWFIGGDNTGKITEITEETGSDDWEHQYVLGDYKIEPIEEEKEEMVEIDGKKFSKATIKEALKKYIEEEG